MAKLLCVSQILNAWRGRGEGRMEVWISPERKTLLAVKITGLAERARFFRRTHAALKLRFL